MPLVYLRLAILSAWEQYNHCFHHYQAYTESSVG